VSAAGPLPAEFYARPVPAVAHDLLGATVRHGPVCVRITEVEAYGGLDDPASHAFRGPTPRAAVMFGPPGRAYVYFIYGMYWCLNLVCEPAGRAAAVLVRAGEVVDGLDLARARAPHLADRDLARGPGRLARVLAVDGGLTGTPVTGGGPLAVLPGPAAARTGGDRADQAPADRVRSGPRVGVRGAHDWPWRYWVAGDPTVSTTAKRNGGPSGPAADGTQASDQGGTDAAGRRAGIRPG
jgi:DNA-3-methyladenine glycosylase